MSKLTCLVCLQKFPQLPDDNLTSSYLPRLLSSPPTGSEGNLYTRFLHFCTRHLKLTSLPLINGREDNEVFCPECKCLVSCLCDLWHEMEVVKLHLDWKLEKLGEMFKVLGKNSRAEKDLIKQLELDSIRVRRFRAEVKQSCKQRRECNPKVVVSRRIIPELWKFSYSETKSTLARLIFVFALAFDKEEGSTNQASTVKTEESDIRDAEEYPGAEGFNEFASDCSNAASPPELDSDAEFIPVKPKRRRITRKKNKTGQSTKWKHPVENIKCSMCPQIFRKSTSLVEHLKTAHSIRRPSFKCEICYKVFKTFYIMRRHIKSHGQAPSRQGEGLMTPSETSLRQRRRRPNKFSSSAATCKICKENLYFFWNLETHMISTHETDEKSYYCWFCPERFSLKETRLAHRWNGRKHRHRKMFKCDFDNCQQYFQCPDTHEQHLKSHLGSAEAFKRDPDQSKEIHHCSKCNLGFFYEDGLVFHELNHLESNGDTFNCPKCPKSYSEKRLLLLHYKPSHLEDYGLRRNEPSLDRKFKCDKCDYLAYDEKGLKKHLIMHKEKEPLECEQCGVICHGKMAKQVHLKTEHQQNFEEYPCPVCGKSFLTPGEVTKHMRRVHCEKRFFCDICGVGFKHRCNLKDHERYHDANRTAQHICSSCGKAYFTTQGLKFHINSAHVAEEEKGFGCPYCKKRFHREDLAKGHVKTCMKQRGLEVPDDDKIEVIWSTAAMDEKITKGRRRSKLISGRIAKESGDGKSFDKFLY